MGEKPRIFAVYGVGGTCSHWFNKALPDHLYAVGFDYDTKDLLCSTSCSTDIQTLATELLNIVITEMILDEDDRPIIFAAWDIGGSIVKEALLIASSSQEAFEAAVINRTTTLLFFGTPHTCAAPENWEAVLLAISCRLSGDTCCKWLPQFVGLMADYHRSLEARFRRFPHRYKIVQYIQGSGDADFSKHVASLNCDKEEFVMRHVPLNQATVLLEEEVRQQLWDWLEESRTVLNRSFQELIYELNLKSEPLLEQSRVGSWMFMQTAEFCFQHEAARSWLLTKATYPLILRIPPLVDCRFMFNSIVSYIKDTTCSETGVTKYQVVFLDLYPLPATRTTTLESLLSTLIHRIIDEYPRFWDLPATVPINELVSLIRSNPPVSELTLWRVLKLILASLGDQSIVCLLRLSEVASRDGGVQCFLRELASVGKIVDTNFKLAIVTKYGANIDIDLETDVFVAQATADDINFKIAVRKDLSRCVHDFSASNSTLSSSSNITDAVQADVWADFDPSSLVPTSLMAHLRYIQTCPLGRSRKDIATNRLLSNLSRSPYETLACTIRAVPEMDLPPVVLILSVVLLARRPLSLLELEAILTLSTSAMGDVAYSPWDGDPQQVITAYLTPLLHLHGGTIHFLDDSLREAFNQWRSDLCHEISVRRAQLGGDFGHFQLARICLACIKAVGEHRVDHAMSEGDQQITGNHKSSLSQPDFLNSPEFPLLRYAVQHWPFHLKSSLSGLDEVEATQLAESRPLEYLGDKQIVESWLRQAFNLRFPRITVNDYTLSFASQLSPCRIMQKYGIPLLQAIEVTWDSLSVIHILDWNIGASLAWALTKITGSFQASAIVWHNSTRHDKEKNLKLLVDSMRLCSKTSINLIFHVQREHIDANIPDLLFRDLIFGGTSLLAYIAEEGRRQHSAVRLRIPKPLHVFSAIGFSSMIGSLLDYRDNGLLGTLDDDESDSSLLHLAASSGHDVVVERLAGLNIDINARDAKGRTALFLASQCGFSRILDILLRPNGATNISLPNNEGQTPLHAATQGGHIRCVTALLEAGNTLGQPIQEDISALISIGVKSNYQSLVSLLLEYGKHRYSMPGDVRIDGSQLDVVSESNDTTYLKGKQYPDILTISIQDQHSEMAKLLVERGVDLGFLDDLQRGPLHLAAKRSQHRVVAALLARGADVNVLDSYGKTPLYYAAENGDTVCISLLLEAKASVNRVSIFSAAEIAIRNGHDQAAQILISTNSSNKHCSQALGEWLHCAAISGLTHVATQLLDMGADKDYQDTNKKYSALHLAVLRSQIDIVRLLLIRRVSLELETKYGETALSSAVEEDEEHSVEIIKLLLDAGANLETTDKEGKTPLAIAYQGESNDTVMFLLEQGANICHPSVNRNMLLKALEKSPKVDGLKVLAAQKTNFVSDAEHVDYVSSLLGHACRMPTTQDVVSVLLQAGADPNYVSDYNSLAGGVLQQAVYDSYIPIVKGLLEHPDTGLNINGIAGKFGTVLNFSVAKQSISAEQQWAMFQYLVQSGADPQICAGCYGTPIHTAVALSTIDVVEHILNHSPTKMCLDSQDHEGRLPAHIVALSGNEDLLPIFLTGVYLDKPDRQGRQPIHLASGIGFLTMLDYLAQQCKAEERELASLLSASDNDGWTPLHWACRQDDKAVVKWLVEKGPDAKSARTIRENWTPYDVAKAERNLGFCELLGYTEVDDDKAGTLLPNTWYTCDSCRCSIFDKAYSCAICTEFYLCFKCYFHVKDIHYEGHSFDTEEVLDSPW